MADENLGTGTVTIEISDVSADRSLDALADKIEQKLDRAARVAGRRIELAVARSIRRINPAKIDIEADMSRFNAVLRAQSNLSDIEILVPALPKVSPPEWKRLIQAAVAGIEIKIKVVPDVSGFNTAIHQITAPTIRANVQPQVDNDRLLRAANAVDRAIAGTLKASAGFASVALKFGAIGIAAASAAQSVIGLVGALAPAVGIVAAAPAAILGFVGALGALKLATAGVGDAFGAALSGDSKKFQQALESLSPAAQKVAREVRALKPEFDSLKNSVQDALFKPLVGQVTAVAKALDGTLKTGLTGISAEFGRAAANAASFLKSGEAATHIGNILTSSKQAVAGLADGITNLTAGFLRAGSVVSQAFGARLGESISNVSNVFGKFLTNTATDGRLVAWVEGALTVFKQLGGIVANVGGILFNVFSAANAVGGGFLANLQTITRSFLDFTGSVQGQTALQNVFTALASVAAQLGPIIGALVTQLGNIAPALAPLFTTIGPAIVTVINSLGPAIQGILPGIQSLVSGLADGFEQIASSGALTAVGQALGKIGTAIAPLLPVIGQLVGTLGNALAPVLSALAPFLGAVVGAVGSLVTALSPLITLAGELIAKLGPILTPIVTALGQVFAAFTPVIQTLADTLSSVLGPILDLLPQLIQPFLDQVVTLAQTFLPLFNDLLVQLQPSLMQISDALVQVVTALIPVITQMTQLTTQILVRLIPILTPLIDLIGKLAAIFSGKLAQVLIGIVVPALEAVSQLISGDVSGAFDSLGKVVKNSIKFVIDLMTQLPLQIIGALANIGSLLLDVGKQLIQGMINGIKSAAGALIGAAKGVVSDAIDGAKSLLGINSPSKVFFVIGTQTGQGLINGLNSMASKVGTAASDMAAAAVAPFDGLAVSGPTVNGFNSGSALAAITQPFGNGSTQGITTTTTSRQSTPGGTGTGNSGAAIQNTFNITEVGDASVTAERVINRMVTAAGVFL